MGSSRARATGLFVGLATVLGAGAARGEFWASSLRDLLREARSVEEVTVTAVRPDGQWTVRVEDSLRGRPAGTVASVQPFWLSGPSVAPGSRALLICDAGQCPRAVGVERAGAWVLSAQEPGDGAAVMPTIVERRAWRDIAAGRPVPPLCVNVTLGFVDEPAATESLRVSLAADTGGGSATGAVLGSAGTTAQASLGSRNDSIELALTTPRGNVLIEAHGLAAGLTRAPDGCLAVRGDVERPFARTRAELRSDLATGNRSVTLGRGALRCAEEGALPYCGTQMRLVANDGNLALAVGGSRVINVHSTRTLPRTNLLRVGFMLSDGGVEPLLTLDVPAPARANPSLFFTLASALRASALRARELSRARARTPKGPSGCWARSSSCARGRERVAREAGALRGPPRALGGQARALRAPPRALEGRPALSGGVPVLYDARPALWDGRPGGIREANCWALCATRGS